MGHWSASQSLRQQLLHSFPGASAEVLDLPAYAMPNLSEAMYKCFNLVVTHGTHLFNTYYKLTALGHPDARPPMEDLFLDKLTQLLQARQPDAVIATHPLCAQLMSRLKGESGLDLPLITCVTDVTSHPEWINQNTDCYLVPSHEVRRALAEKGVDPALVCVTGIPVREEFRTLPRRPAGRGKKRELLIMGGGLGLLPRDLSFYQALDSIPNTHVTIITGRNQKLFRRLQGRWPSIQVVGYTDRVWDYMARADLIVTKPGGITLFETIFAQVPILTWPPALQQERSNARWLARAGIGWVASQENCAQEIREILLDSQRLSGAAAQMGRLREQLEVESLNALMAVIAQNKEAAV
ncbi:MAG: UDP-diphospho-muramoylpentapeptide beta-N-acetylglucosaminyltransferase [Lawsonibacter sp.]|nr:UDP-diphospho-muramoylpentapeptide beta-N-acetylglucosaminyltransferase [Lawsonibacter sp.]